MDRHSTVPAFARFGLAAKGVVYMLIAGLAFGAALGSGQAGDSRDAMSSLSGERYGTIMLGVIGSGLLAYALWRLYSGIANTDDDKPGKRLLHVGTGLINAVLALEALRIAFLQGRTHTGNKAPHWTAELMAQPFGVWLVAGVGILIAGYGLSQVMRALRSKLDKLLHLGELSTKARMWVRRVARAGLGARGIVFAVAGIFLIKASLEQDPSQARDLGASLQAVQQQPFGKWLLTGMAVGLFMYGFYNLVRARYRVIHT